MMTVEMRLEIPDAVKHWTQPGAQAWQHALQVAAAVAMRDCVRNFERQGYEDPPGVFHPWKELSPITLERAQERAKMKVGGESARIRKVRTPLGPLQVAVGSGGEQKTARVRRQFGSMILIDTGRLRASLLGGPNHVERQAGTQIVVGTNVQYAGAHEFGTTIPVTEGVRNALGAKYGVWVRVGGTLRVPPRPYLRLSQQGMEQMARLFLRALATGGKG
jgi:phage gpG-like protein